MRATTETTGWGRDVRAGFTLVELLVLIGILVVLLSIFIPYIADLREADKRTRCADNLRLIHGAFGAYALANAKADGTELPLPRVRYEPTTQGDTWTAYSGAAANDPFAPGGGVKPNDVTASLFLLVREGLIGPDRFVCPSAPHWPDPLVENGKPVAAESRSNFAGPDHLSYAVASPFGSAIGYRWSTDWLKGDFAVVADKGPGVRGKGDDVTAPAWKADPFDLAQANSSNHDKAGQNVLYADGHVSFQRTPYCGVGKKGRRDNIYTALAPHPLTPGTSPPAEGKGYWGPQIGPSWAGDSYLVPSDDE